ncbi:hypothetical protein D3C84_771920 [compost metagenome]
MSPVPKIRSEPECPLGKIVNAGVLSMKYSTFAHCEADELIFRSAPYNPARVPVGVLTIEAVQEPTISVQLQSCAETSKLITIRQTALAIQFDAVKYMAFFIIFVFLGSGLIFNVLI